MIEHALSLRDPQAESLDLLAQIADKISLTKNFDLAEALALIQEVAPNVKDFERAFPSVCFSLATGVGKTRLMGAFIAYLYLEKGIRNFFVLAPNLTIYRKLITDFTPNTPKYVFPGIPDFAINPPMIITGETYSQIGDLLDNGEDKIRINIFNISKIDSDKDSATGLPRIRRMAEYLGQPYFEYLADLDDLVLLMDEAHRYRASAGMAALNELSPVLGLELTATPKSTGAKGATFKNIAYDYNLAKAIHDGFVKKPAIVGRTDFNKEQYTDEKLEALKIKDGLDIHESIKAELQVYADNKKARLVKPFMLIIAKNIEHAEEINKRINSDDFENGKYKGKAIVVHSKKSGEEKDEVVERLLAVERTDEPTEIVIHVDMLKEGWDVNNLYTIVPLKTADSKILVEQSIGRGLRLPFGRLIGIEALDRLHVVAHDKFSEIIKAATDKKFDFQVEYIDGSNGIGKKVATENKSKLEKDLEEEGVLSTTTADTGTENAGDGKQALLPVFANPKNKMILDKTQEGIEELSNLMSSSKDLLVPENQERLCQYVAEKIQEETPQAELSLDPTLDIKETVKKITEKFVENNLDIPRIKITHRQKTGFTFKNFDLQLTPFDGLKPVPREILIKELLGTKQEKRKANFQDIYEDINDYVVIYLIENQAINYSKDADLIYKLTEQAISHIRSYASDELTTRQILFFHGERIAEKIFEQMKAHLQRAEFEIVIKVDSGYATLTSYKILEDVNIAPINFRNPVPDKTKMRSYVFEGFEKCLFQKQKFDSDTEKELSKILEDEASVVRWFKINDDKAKEIFDLKYPDADGDLHYYCPDFVVETGDAKYIIETKSENQVKDAIVQAKAKVAKDWCSNATTFELQHGGKTWHYLLIPHTTFVADRSFAKLVSDFEVK